jgi:hypothetical protein
MKDGQRETPRACEIERKKGSVNEMKFSSERVPQASVKEWLIQMQLNERIDSVKRQAEQHEKHRNKLNSFALRE